MANCRAIIGGLTKQLQCSRRTDEEGSMDPGRPGGCNGHGSSETLLQQKLNPGLCSVHPDKPFQYGEKAWLLPRGDVVFQQYVDQWLHLAQATGEYQAISDKWLK